VERYLIIGEIDGLDMEWEGEGDLNDGEVEEDADGE
jgi:hypothetical protein